MAIYGVTGSPTYSISYDTIYDMLESVPNNNRQLIGATAVRNSLFTLWNKIEYTGTSSGIEEIAAIIQIGIANPAHFHFGYLTKAQAQTLISRNTLSYDYQDNDWIEMVNPGIDIVTTDVNMHTHTVRVNFNNFTGLFFIVASTIPVGHEGRILMQDSTYASVCTRSQMDTKIAQNELHPGTLYKISNADNSLYNGTEIFLEALTTNTLSKTGHGVFYNPIYDQGVAGFGILNADAPEYVSVPYTNLVGAFSIGETIQIARGPNPEGILIEDTGTELIIQHTVGYESLWINYISTDILTGLSSGATADATALSGSMASFYNIGDTVIWGGKVWTNLTGSVGTVGDVFNLSAPHWIEGSFITVTNVVDGQTLEFTGDLTDRFRVGYEIYAIDPSNISLGDYIVLTSTYDSGTDTTTITLNNDNGTDIVYVTVKSFNPFDYNPVIDQIEYDYINDLIVSRKEIKGDNEVSFDITDLSGFPNNPIKAFQWGNPFDMITGIGMGRHYIINSYNENINFTGLRQIDFNLKTLSRLEGNIFTGNSYQENITLENKSYQSGLNFTDSGQYNITLINNSYQDGFTFTEGSLQNSIVLINNSYQNDFVFANGQQTNITLSEQSYQGDINISAGGQQNMFLITSSSYQSSINLEESNQYNFIFKDGSNQNNFTFTNGSQQQDIQLNKSIQADFTFNSGFQNEIYFENSGQNNFDFSENGSQQKFYFKNSTQSEIVLQEGFFQSRFYFTDAFQGYVEFIGDNGASSQQKSIFNNIIINYGSVSITGTAYPETDSVYDNNTITYKFSKTLDASANNGIGGDYVTIPYLVAPENYFFEEVWVETDDLDTTQALLLGFIADSGDEGLNLVTGDIPTLVSNITTRVIHSAFTKSTSLNSIGLFVTSGSDVTGTVTFILKLRKII